jgi:fatty acid desaturase
VNDLQALLILFAAPIGFCWFFLLILLIGVVLPMRLYFKAVDAWDDWKQERQRKQYRARHVDGGFPWRWPSSPH